MKLNRRLTIIVAAAVLAGIFIGRGCAGRQADHSGRTPVEPGKAIVKFWTCSMHPEIKLPDPGKCPKCAMDLIPVMASDDGESLGLRELKLSPSAQAIAEVETALVERRFVTKEVYLVGKIDYDEARLATLSARVPGRLDRLFVDYTGVEVNKADHMVSIYSPALLAAQEELLQAIETVQKLQGSDNSLIKDSSADNVVSSREKLRLWGLNDDQISDIEKRGKAEDHLTIYSPISGIVINKNAREGDYVETGSPIYTIADLSKVWVMLDAYESDLSWIHYGQDMEFQTESYPGRTFRGTIAFIDPVLNEMTRTIKVRVNVDNPRGDLKPGMFVRATVRADISSQGGVFSPKLAGKWISPMHPEIIKDAPGKCDICGMPLVSAESLGYVMGKAEEAPLVIPATAALITGRRAIVYVKSPDEPGVFEGREIVLGPRAGAYYLVRRGLHEGERVVTKGNFKLDAELQIHAKPSMMTPGGGMAGMHHAGPEAGATRAPGGKQHMAETQARLQAVLDAAQAVDDAIGTADLDKIRAAFSGLRKQVDDVNGQGFGEATASVWKELAMLLGNDGIEGSTVDSVARARRVAQSLREHSASLQNQLGLSHANRVAKMAPVDPAFRTQIEKVLNGYLQTQTALADDDFSKATTAAKDTLASLSALDMGLVSGDDHTAWMKQITALDSALSKVAGAGTLEEFRSSFSPLSELIMATTQRFGGPAQPVYQFQCPMALDGVGATWIQNDKETRNPYFGASMLECGSVINSLPGNEAHAGHTHD